MCEPGHALGKALLLGLQSLLGFYLPAVLAIGHDVRELTWEGGLTGTAKGVLARQVLQRCLGVQLALLQDWECKCEYTRSLSIALLQWQPALSAMPGCCFVEESCEALLSRMVGRVRANTNVVSFEGILQLYVTLPLPSREPKGTSGCIRQTLVQLIGGRLLKIIDDAASQPYAAVQSARSATWMLSPPPTLQLPPPPTPDTTVEQLERVLQGALVCLSSVGVVSSDLRDAVHAMYPVCNEQDFIGSRRLALQRVRSWRTERRQRLVLSQQPPQPAQVATHGDSQQDVAPLPVDPINEPDAVGSEGSLYEPPPLSAGFHSYGDTDSLGSMGELMEPAHTGNSTLSLVGLDDLEPPQLE